jgi:hypothetical protein
VIAGIHRRRSRVSCAYNSFSFSCSKQRSTLPGGFSKGSGSCKDDREAVLSTAMRCTLVQKHLGELFRAADIQTATSEVSSESDSK